MTDYSDYSVTFLIDLNKGLVPTMGVTHNPSKNLKQGDIVRTEIPNHEVDEIRLAEFFGVTPKEVERPETVIFVIDDFRINDEEKMILFKGTEIDNADRIDYTIEEHEL